jgi:osmotically-inducible protein OsmY
MKTDTQLQHDVLAELEWEPSINASQIGVTAKDGVVALTGAVASYADKMTAERVAKRVYGVKAVANDVEVKIPGSGQRSDADIAAAALTALQWDTTVPDDRVKVTVRNGWITLEGKVDWGYQKDSAERVVRNLTGIKGLTSEITVKSQVKPGDVKVKIEAAFRRSAELDARRVSVQAQEGKVILYGNVRSWAGRDEAQQAAWAAAGVSEVDNRLTVTP